MTPFITLLIGSYNPDQEDEVGSDADDSVGHETGPELEVLQHEDEYHQDYCVDYRVDPAELVRRNQSLPLDYDQLEVEQVDQQQTQPNAQIVKDLHSLVAVEVPKDRQVEVRLVPQVLQAQVAGVVAEDTSEDDNQEGEQVPCFQSRDREDQDETADHAVDHSEDGHCGTQAFIFVVAHVDLEFMLKLPTLMRYLRITNNLSPCIPGK